jgi:hypothetical protein
MISITIIYLMHERKTGLRAKPPKIPTENIANECVHRRYNIGSMSPLAESKQGSW